MHAAEPDKNQGLTQDRPFSAYAVEHDKNQGLTQGRLISAYPVQSRPFSVYSVKPEDATTKIGGSCKTRCTFEGQDTTKSAYSVKPDINQ